MTQDQIDRGLAIGKQVVTYGAGFATAVGVNAFYGLTPDAVQTDFDHIFNGIKEICIGAGPLVGAAVAWWAQHSASMKVKVADVKAAAPAVLVQAVQAVSPVTLRDAVAAQPEVKAVLVNTKAVADASPSEKVTT